MRQKVFVVTNTELGWDCVCAVYTNSEAAEKYKGDSETIIITEMYLEDEFEE
jgi:hypothetical protein